MGTDLRGTGAGEGAGALDTYDVAFLAGGVQRVVDSAIIALSERGLLVVRASRVRAVDGGRAGHPVERALVEACAGAGGRSVAAARQLMRHSPEVDEIGRRLAARGLVRRPRLRPTREGRRQLEAVVRAGSVPAYLLDGPAGLGPGPVRRGVMDAAPLPSGLGRLLVRMGKALDDDSGWGSDSGDSGSGCGGGGGGD
ncbi:TIGR04222 domain-containing membrane protein [Streptomyces fructofermentans]|uniref:TIGR04222 domain-containing membrane protein n=1 Tax=Streptomyces fructofermentans TaxID=152141 RepID=UPI0037B08816